MNGDIKIGKLLCDEDIITKRQLNKALQTQVKGDKRTLGEILVDLGFCDCYGSVFDECGICGGDSSSCDYQFFDSISNDTGVNQLVFIENVLGLEPGDEIGLYDTNALLNSGDCLDQTGELLVGAGIWDTFGCF